MSPVKAKQVFLKTTKSQEDLSAGFQTVVITLRYSVVT